MSDPCPYAEKAALDGKRHQGARAARNRCTFQPSHPSPPDAAYLLKMSGGQEVPGFKSGRPD